jgi:NAD-dependent SIR2 family protein deacetylase
MERQVATTAAVERLAELIRGSRCTVVLSGAGVSVPSGIPDFRTPETGLWANVDPMEVAHIDVFERDPARFWSYYRPRFQSLGDKRPNPAHEALAELERRGLVEGVIPESAMARARDLAERAELMICVGSSLAVYPVAGLPQLTLERGGRLALVTKGDTPYDGDAELKLGGEVVEELGALLAALA